ncbi:MAG: peptidoglycan DD-metalloendopeptidase family protein [Patescibacteria group bacterium]
MKKLLLSILIILIISAPTRYLFSASTIEELNNKIQEQRQQAEEIQKKIDNYQKTIAAKQAAVNSLKKQLIVLDDKIEQSRLDLQSNELNLSTVNLEIQSISLEIESKDNNIEEAKGKISEILRQLYLADQHSLLEILVLNAHLSDFFDQLNYLGELQSTLQANVNELQTLKVELERQQQDLSNKKIHLLDIKKSIETSKSLLEATKESKNLLSNQARDSESRYQSLLSQAAAEQEAANNDINKLEAALREKLSQKPQDYEQLNDTNFIWSVNPLAGITAYFHDPSYPFRRYFEHPAIDIRARQGMPIKAAASGIVGRAKDAGFGYSYILLVHAEGFSTVYGHVSRIDVVEGNFVTKGQVIGAVGGTPGTLGAGKLTTGPHLHFEIRYNGLPVDPLNYLP